MYFCITTIDRQIAIRALVIISLFINFQTLHNSSKVGTCIFLSESLYTSFEKKEELNK